MIVLGYKNFYIFRVFNYINDINRLMVDKINVVIITGGDNLESESSWKSAYNVYDLIGNRDFNRFLVSVVNWRWTIVKTDVISEKDIDDADIVLSDFSIIYEAEKFFFDVAFISIHGYPGETGHLQSFLDLVDIKYVGSDVLTSAIAANKFLCNEIVRNSTDLHLAKQKMYETRTKSLSEKIKGEFNYPCIIKPNSYGSGIGVALVTDDIMLDRSLDLVKSLGCDVLVEDFIEGREITVGALVLNGSIHVLPIAEVTRPRCRCEDGKIKNMFYTSRQGAEICFDVELCKKTGHYLNEATAHIGKVLGCKSFYRIDYILGENNAVYFLEVNTIPGMTSKSVFTKQIEKSEYRLDEVYNLMIEEVVSN